MTNARIGFLLLTLVVGTGVAAQKDGRAKLSGSESADLFQKIRPTLLEKTQVPLRLPSYLGRGMKEEDGMSAILEKATPSEYEIQLAWDATCDGGNWCHVGTLKGSKEPIPIGYDGERKTSAVSLAQSIKGTFAEARCYAYCEESVVSWQQDGYYYEIGVKAGRKLELVKTANSAIASGVLTRK